MAHPDPGRYAAGPTAIQHERLGTVPYEPTWRRMQRFTETREPTAPDRLWTLQHPPVFTLGLNASREHLLNPGDVPVVPVDRGGQVTYHGPGQLVVYPLLDVRRREIGVRALVSLLERAVVELLAAEGVTAAARPDAPGVYVDGAKVASVGLRIRRGCSYHGLSVNVDMDLTPFSLINPCGHAGMPVTDLAGLGVSLSVEAVENRLADYLIDALEGRG
ncbi:lipoyl(octanoyl) transferase LipB [Ectothiorhodospiraceae bacterium WFHF3C12]|nr:lipoyl(octanoyl) transferase LipB [Ectothiorhodospiraceae bacterium WFHF3C12]